MPFKSIQRNCQEGGGRGGNLDTEKIGLKAIVLAILDLNPERLRGSSQKCLQNYIFGLDRGHPK